MHWREASLGGLCTLGPQYGANAKALPASGRRPRYIRITDITEEGKLRPDSVAEADTSGKDAYDLVEGDILFARSGATVGKTYLHTRADGPSVFAGYLIRFRPDQDLLNPRFLFFFTRSPQYLEWVASKRRVAAQPNINGGEYASLRIPLPTPSEQRRIVEILEQADYVRCLHTEADTKADRILPALFLEMRAEPAGAKKRLDEVVAIGGEFVDPRQEEYFDLPHVGGEQIEKGTGRIVGLRTVRETRLKSGKYAFGDRHVLYSKIRPYLNKVAYPRFAGLCSADIYPLLPKDSAVGPWFLTALLRSDAFLAYARSQSDRLRMPKLNREQLGAYSVALPDRAALEAFESRSTRLALVDERRLEGKRRIGSLFKLMVHSAFSGSLTSRWREGHMKEMLRELEYQAQMLPESAPSVEQGAEAAKQSGSGGPS